MAAAAILKNEKSPYLTNGLTDRHKTFVTTQFEPIDPSDCYF